MANSEKTKHLIIGNSAGGIGAAEAIREADKTGTITIVSDEPYPAYSRPLISEHLADNYPVEKMLFRPADFYETNNINTILGQKATGIDTARHSVTRTYWRKAKQSTINPMTPPYTSPPPRSLPRASTS